MLMKIKQMDIFVSFQMLHYYKKKWLNEMMMFISSCGDFGMSWLIVILVTNNIASMHDMSVDMLVALLIATLIGQVTIKTIVKRKRPCQEFQNVKILIPIPSDYSFPSSHTMTSFACSTVIMLYYPILGCIGAIYAILTGLSRIYLFVHYLSDVIVGTVLGIIIGFIVFIL